jgi:NOL1/NOP2/fmu family ribosome biogenesis protein
VFDLQQLNFLNSKARKELVLALEEKYGFSGDVPGHLLLSGKDKLFILSDSELIRRGLDKDLRIDRAGLKIGTKTLGGIRLNIEGSQFLGPDCSRRLLQISSEHLELFVKGEDFALNESELRQALGESGLFIVKHNLDFIGSGLVKEGRLLSQLSKNRKVKNLNF